MGRTLLVACGLVGLIGAGCAAGPIEVSVAPTDADLPVDDLAFDAADSTPAADSTADDDMVAPFSAVLVVDVEHGYVFDGTYVPAVNEPAMHWTVQADIDEPAAYGRVSVGTTAGPGAVGCMEAIESAGGVFTRSSFETGRMGAFEGDPSSGALVESYAAISLGLADDLRAVPDGESWSTIQTPDGGLESAAVLTTEGVAAARALLPDPSGVDTVYDAGTLVMIEDPDGHLVSVALAALFEVDGARETLELGLSYQSPQPPVAVDSPWAVDAGCPSAATRLGGEWRILRVGETAVTDLPSLGQSSFLFDSDGGFSGTTGCQELTGRADFGFSWMDNVELELDGQPCDGIEGVIEAELVAAMSGDATFGTDDDGNLLVVGTDQIITLSPVS